MLIWQSVLRKWGENLRCGEVKRLARGRKAAPWMSALRSNHTKELASLRHTESLQALTRTSHQLSVPHPRCLFSSLHSRHLLVAFHPCLHALPVHHPYPSLNLPFQEVHSLLVWHDSMSSLHVHLVLLQLYSMHRFVWIANCYSASSMNSSCLGQACSQKGSLLSLFLKIIKEREKSKAHHAPKKCLHSHRKPSNIENKIEQQE